MNESGVIDEDDFERQIEQLSPLMEKTRMRPRSAYPTISRPKSASKLQSNLRPQSSNPYKDKFSGTNKFLKSKQIAFF